MVLALFWLLGSAPQGKALQADSWATTTARGTSTKQVTTADWWNSFHDETLTRLIARAVAQSLDLKLAAARVEEARAARGLEKSALYPSLSAGVDASRHRQ